MAIPAVILRPLAGPCRPMARPRLPASEKRPEVKIYPSPAILAWVDGQTGAGKRFYNRTHAFEFAMSRLMDSDAGPAKGRQHPESR